MKRWNIILIAILAVILVVMYTVNVSTQDKKEVAKVVQIDHKCNCTDGCQGTHAEAACKDHAAKCNCEKCNCTKEKCDCPEKPCTEDCQKKHAAGECKDHKPGACCQSDKAKKSTETEEKK